LTKAATPATSATGTATRRSSSMTYSSLWAPQH